jgi:hypothetical protein
MNYRLERIIRGIAEKGGLYGKIAFECLNEEEMAKKFIKECGEQIHNVAAQKLWGLALINEIDLYCKEAGYINPFRNKKLSISEVI